MLLVIDFEKEKLTYLDSFPMTKSSHNITRSIKTMALFMEGMLQSGIFYDNPSTPRPLVSHFHMSFPSAAGSQGINSNDCAVFVILWMTSAKEEEGYKVEVDNGSRLQIAIDLVLAPYNKHKSIVMQNAEDFNARKKRSSLRKGV
ncbi:uncharacterized protein LOC123920828 [Trifolium pratense]|uniref:uncharacterized protein LOC123886761 n=1 Tax=Trifolium pratense TaxID=57577 RepID=UPI001E6947BB|nr:uncharacterized protein LOC123886761 [Trifolium pratense]XP_045798193.1 uncharacterized protein LOC123892456 [Trifolium pratense]XP_045807957.1 uncharacterized protein LOC123902316 [Trifolium pratense]XP_045818535.1 uncharacterized protein LOC123911208 [Trifolium pratense]XP_045823325.1 uncharacterized protein LOC123916041 [Trifolium pratense]XP_045829104.1 uncharacterized protein LOC123920828 [Trifolium pratense]